MSTRFKGLLGVVGQGKGWIDCWDFSFFWGISIVDWISSSLGWKFSWGKLDKRFKIITKLCVKTDYLSGSFNNERFKYCHIVLIDIIENLNPEDLFRLLPIIVNILSQVWVYVRALAISYRVIEAD